MCGANHFPGSSTTSEVVSNDSSPENTFSFVASDSFGFSSTNRPYDPLLARNLQPIVKRRIRFVSRALFDDMLKEAIFVGIHFDHAAKRC